MDRLHGLIGHGYLTLDNLTIAVSLAVMGIKIPLRAYRGHWPCMSKQRCIVDLMNGATIIPFAVMLISVFQDELFRELVKTNLAFLSLAGAIGLVFMIGEILKGEP